MSSSTAKDSTSQKKKKGKSGKSPGETAGVDTRLHHADSAHHVVKYLKLIENHNCQDVNGDSPIHVFVKRKDKHKFECLMSFLIHSECTIDLVNSKDGMTALHLACEIDDLLSAKALIAFNADLNLINFDGFTPLDIVRKLPTSTIDPLLISLGALPAKAVCEIERQESQEYNATHNDFSPVDPPSPSFTPLHHEHETVRNRFGFDSQLLDHLSMDSEVSNSGEKWEFHDSREEERTDGGLLKGSSTERVKVKGHGEVTHTHQHPSKTLESVPEKGKFSIPLSSIKGVRFQTPDSSIEMALTEVSVQLAKERIGAINSVTSGTSVLQNNLFPMNISPASVSPDYRASPLLESFEEVEEDEDKKEGRVEAKSPKIHPKSLADAYSQIFTPSSSEPNAYRQVQNLFSLDETVTETETETDGLHNGHRSEAKTVHFETTPKLDIHKEHREPKECKEPEERTTLCSYRRLDGDLYKQFEMEVKDLLDKDIESSLGNDGYTVWLQWREMKRAKEWRAELNKGLDLEETDTNKQIFPKELEGGKAMPNTIGQHLRARPKPPKNLPLQHDPEATPPLKPPRKNRSSNVAAPSGCKRKVQYHNRLHRVLQSPMSNVFTSITNPRMTVMQSILGTSVAPFGIKRGERILCLDGGGIKGLIQIEILKHIETMARKPIIELFDWIVGTSTGGIVALGLVYAKRSLDDLKKMYFELKEDVFKQKSKIIGCACDTKALENLLVKTLGAELTLKSETKPKVLITAVDKTTTRLPLVFFNNCFDNQFSDHPVWKVARYTSAAPIYFEELDNYVDGGVVANNPCDYGMVEIQRYLREQNSKPEPGKSKPQKPIKAGSNIACVVSIGCGIYPAEPIGNTNILDAMKITKITAAPHRIKNLMTLLTSALGKSEDVARICQNNCEQQEIPYYRFSPQIGQEVGTAETDNEKLCDIIIGAKKLLYESEDHLLNLLEHLGC